jgi:thiol-disulfide isomerase/thioredoxin
MTPARPGVASTSAAYPAMASAYSSLARGQGDFLHADSALMILDEADRVFGTAFPDGHRWLDGQREMYRLVGTRATPVEGKWWINASDGSTLMPGDGKVSVIQFTAHWCVPCKHSYPGMLAMSKHFAGKPVESVLETYLYGYIGKRMGLAPEQEVAADRDYYTGEYGLPFKIAINPTPARGDTTTKDTERRYAVGGIPQIVVVDQKGIIRATVVGWDMGNEKRLTALIDRILLEK